MADIETMEGVTGEMRRAKAMADARGHDMSRWIVHRQGGMSCICRRDGCAFRLRSDETGRIDIHLSTVWRGCDATGG